MPNRLKTFFTIILLILLFETSLGLTGSSEDGSQPAYLVSKQVYTRKALVEVTLDYDYGGANPKHDPRKGKPGGKGP